MVLYSTYSAIPDLLRLQNITIACLKKLNVMMFFFYF